MDQTPVQHEMPAETTLQKRGAKDARIATGGENTERFTLCFAVMADGSKVLLRIIFKVREGQENSAPEGVHRGVDVSRESYEVWAPCDGHVFWCAEEEPHRSILVLDDFRCHKEDAFVADLLKKANTTVIMIPGGLTPMLQPLDRMLNKQMKRLLRGEYNALTATAVADKTTGKLKPPGRRMVSTWSKEAWAAITPGFAMTCFKICGLTLSLDGSEDH
ncbi:unnamed protein product, partial [Hapterophycus canaliculatus]